MTSEYNPTSGLTEEEDKQATFLLSQWKGGRLSNELFTAIAKMVPQLTVEIVAFKDCKNSDETLLLPRPKGDIVWPGMLHTPGSALRTADFHREDQTPLNGAFERIKREIGHDFIPPTYAGRIHRLVERGPEVIEVYCTQLLDSQNLREGLVWHPIDRLAANPKFIQHQIGHILMAQNFHRQNS